MNKNREYFLLKNNFSKLRTEFEWTSFGKYGKGPVKKTFLKDISDSHLLHLIPFIKDKQEYYTIYADFLITLFEKEQEYRMKNYIFIPDYIND